MSITVNEGGVLYELDTVTANENGTLYELDTVHSNEGGTLYEIFSAKNLPNNIEASFTGNTASDTGSPSTFAKIGGISIVVPEECQAKLAIVSREAQSGYTTGLTTVLQLRNSNNSIVCSADAIEENPCTLPAGTYYLWTVCFSVKGSSSGTSYGNATINYRITFS